MATGRTISANFLTELDENVINFCAEISKKIEDNIFDIEQKKNFKNDFGKTSKSRDAGAGRGAGKLQRDALCTRGVTSKGPYSNRNLRWHPLVIANGSIPFAETIERIEIEGEDDLQTLIFVIKEDGIEKKIPSSRVHELNKRYVTIPAHWLPHVDVLKFWNDTLWTQNSCIITAFEACSWQDAIESYAVLGLSIAVDNYGVEFNTIYPLIKDLLKNQNIDPAISLPSINFPDNKEDIINCPLCKVPKSQNPAELPDRGREERFKFAFGGNKRNEGDDSSMQIMHVEPLVESEIRHNAKNVRFGHRWCNVAMTDHSIEETLDFMEFIVKVHNRCN